MHSTYFSYLVAIFAVLGMQTPGTSRREALLDIPRSNLLTVETGMGTEGKVYHPYSSSHKGHGQNRSWLTQFKISLLIRHISLNGYLIYFAGCLLKGVIHDSTISPSRQVLANSPKSTFCPMFLFLGGYQHLTYKIFPLQSSGQQHCWIHSGGKEKSAVSFKNLLTRGRARHEKISF